MSDTHRLRLDALCAVTAYGSAEWHAGYRAGMEQAFGVVMDELDKLYDHDSAADALEIVRQCKAEELGPDE